MAETHGQQPRTAAFDPVLSADWNDDAPTWGVARRDDGRPYRFVLLAVDGQTLDWRMYGLIPISEDEFAEGREMWEHQWGPNGRSTPPALAERIEQLGRAPLPPATAVVLTTALGRGPARVADRRREGLGRDHELLAPGASIGDRLQGGGGRILPRVQFQRLVEQFFGSVDLPELDSGATEP